MLYALFDHDTRIGESASTELGAWENALRAGHGGQVLPPGLHVKRVGENFPQRQE